MIHTEAIVELAKVDLAAVEKWIREEPTLPKPRVQLSSGNLYDWKTVRKRLLETGRKGAIPTL